MKQCRACGETKPLTEFYGDRRKSDGLSVTCKPCFRAKQIEYQMRPPQHQAPEGMKRCMFCKETKPVSEFGRNKNYHDGLHRGCKACASKKFAGWYGNADKPTLAAKQRARYAKDPARYAEYELTAHYGLPRGSYAKMLEAQDGKCAICKTNTPGDRAKRFAVDHCHETGKVRGLLCGSCNRGIGNLKHSEEILLSAIDYLKSSAE